MGGFVSYSGDSWWVEETHLGIDRGLKVLTEGKLDFATNSFAGTWRSNSRNSGHYSHFASDRVTKTYKPVPQATIVVQEMRPDESIPAAAAIPMSTATECPVATATGPIDQALQESTPLLPRNRN